MEKPLLDTATFYFLQEPNTNGTTGSEDEVLTITMESVAYGLDAGGFYVIRTSGWSFNEPEDLLDLFKQIKNIKM